MTTSNEHNNAPAVPQGELTLSVEREPDYWSGGHFYEGTKGWINPTKVQGLPIGTKLYTAPAPAQEVGLTDEEITQVCSGIYLSDYPHGSTSYDIALARAIIAALRAKGQS